MSVKHPIISVVGSSGAGTSTVKHTFDQIFRRENVGAVSIEGDAFHRFDRADMKAEMIRRLSVGDHTFSHFSIEANLLEEIEKAFRTYAETGVCRSRRYIHTEEEGEPFGVPAGHFTEWREVGAGSDLLFYEGLHGAVNTADYKIATWADLKIGVVPVINLEWIQKIHRDRAHRGYTTEAVTDTILRRMHDYVNVICPQFTETDINFQRVPMVDTSNPFIARWIPHRRGIDGGDTLPKPQRHRFPVPGVDVAKQLDEPGQFDRRSRRQARPRDAAHPHPDDPPPSRARPSRQALRGPLTETQIREPAVTADLALDMPVTHGDMANAIRALAMEAVERARSGHPGMPMGMADVATVLFSRFLRIDPADPIWPDRDRFVLSAGHGSMLQYALHYLLGYPDIGVEQLKSFRQLGSPTAGHPEFGHALGIETTTGPLGQGLATAVGMALAERLLNARYGDALVDHRTFVIAGDGCLMEGVSHEAIDLAGHLRLGKLVVLWDDNAISIDGPTGLSTSMDQLRRFEAARWHVAAVGGHDPAAIEAAIAAALAVEDRPSMIACKTVIGYGAPTRAGSAKAHGEALGAQELAGAFANLRWPHLPFEIPDPILSAWREVAQLGARARAAWGQRLAVSDSRDAFESRLRQDLPGDLTERLDAYASELASAGLEIATRKASEMVLGVINEATDLTLGGSADLTHSNLTLTPGMTPVAPGEYAGRYIHYGVREHGMAAAMNGLALHGGFIPYGGTFLVFSDYARGAIRLSALMGQRVIYVMTHDSIGLGEDGPTHQPIEHLAMLRATPNLQVFRPADAVETAECWLAALQSTHTPSVLSLSRQALPPLRRTSSSQNLSAQGGYVLRETNGDRDVTLIATGSEVSIAVRAADLLASEGIAAAVVSLPCWERFEARDDDQRLRVLGTAPRVAVEAAARLGWDRWIGQGGAFVGMTGFGASAPAARLYEHFGITPEAVAARAWDLVRGRTTAEPASAAASRSDHQTGQT